VIGPVEQISLQDLLGYEIVQQVLCLVSVDATTINQVRVQRWHVACEEVFQGRAAFRSLLATRNLDQRPASAIEFMTLRRRTVHDVST
jgi:hypothetical protein